MPARNAIRLRANERSNGPRLERHRLNNEYKGKQLGTLGVAKGTWGGGDLLTNLL